jgi:hypothetical protein
MFTVFGCWLYIFVTLDKNVKFKIRLIEAGFKIAVSCNNNKIVKIVKFFLLTKSMFLGGCKSRPKDYLRQSTKVLKLSRFAQELHIIKTQMLEMDGPYKSLWSENRAMECGAYSNPHCIKVLSTNLLSGQRFNVWKHFWSVGTIQVWQGLLNNSGQWNHIWHQRLWK